MERYRVYLHLDLLDSMPKGKARRRIFKFLSLLQDNPSLPGDFTDKDSTLRVRQIKIIGDYAVTYWTDYPVKAVMVVDIRRAD
jgi:hypothetical protein